MRTPSLNRQAGITLYQVAAVLLCFTLLGGGALKGNAVLQQAQAKNLLREMREVKELLDAYRSRYKALPGDDGAVAKHLNGAIGCISSRCNDNLINGSMSWASLEPDLSEWDESGLFWSHLRLAGLAKGDPRSPKAFNVLGGRLGITSSAAYVPVRPRGVAGQYVVCTSTIPGRVARMMDSSADDGDATTGAVWAAEETTGLPVRTAVAPTAYRDLRVYTVCTAF